MGERRDARRARWREQVAREIARVSEIDCEDCRDAGAAGDGCLLDRGAVTFFDVAQAREHGVQLVAEGRAALETWAVYLDWLLALGWSRAPSTFARIVDLPAEHWRLRQLWADGPGRVPCRVCGGTAIDCGDVPCWTCDGGTVPGKRPRTDGAALLRVGRRLLAALEGQPSECQAVRCVSGKREPVHPRPFWEWVECPDCRGTGHNLRGVLPPLVETPAQRWRRAASERRGRASAAMFRQVLLREQLIL